MKFLAASLCFACLPLIGQDNNRQTAMRETLKFLEEQKALAQQQAQAM